MLQRSHSERSVAGVLGDESSLTTSLSQSLRARRFDEDHKWLQSPRPQQLDAL